MRTNETMRNVLSPTWDDFFTTVSKQYDWGRWFKDGDNRTCSYSIESKKTVQAAPRRQHGKDRWNFKEDKKKMFDDIFGRTDWHVNIIFITTGYYQGVWVYDAKEAEAKGFLSVETDRHGNSYFEIPLNICHKICDLWNAPRFCDREELFHIARSQYEYLMKNHQVEKYSDYTELPNWCIWKWFSPWSGGVRESLEDDLRAYVKHAKELPSYIVPEVDAHDLPRHS